MLGLAVLGLAALESVAIGRALALSVEPDDALAPFDAVAVALGAAEAESPAPSEALGFFPAPVEE